MARCRECQDEQVFNLGTGEKPVNLPRYCLGKSMQKGAQTDAKCPMDPYVIIPEECTFID
jgi:DNA replication licensing factor MCM5